MGPSDDRRQKRLELGELSPREREILEAASAGLTAGEIAERFSLSQATVRSHLSSIYGKLGVRGRVELLARLHAAVDEQGLSDPAPAGPPRPPRALRIRSRSRLATLAAVVAIVVGSTLFAFWRPDLPPRTDLGNVALLLSHRQVTQLDLAGTDLTVTRTDGQRLLVQGVSPAAFGSLRATELAATCWRHDCMGMNPLVTAALNGGVDSGGEPAG